MSGRFDQKFINDLPNSYVGTDDEATGERGIAKFYFNCTSSTDVRISIYVLAPNSNVHFLFSYSLSSRIFQDMGYR